MTELLEDAVSRLRRYPPDVQDQIARTLIDLEIDPDFGVLVRVDADEYGLTEADHAEARQEMGT